MKLFVKVKPGIKQTSIKEISPNKLIVSLKEKPEKGKANAALIRGLADYFRVSQSRIKIKIGARGRQKIVEIIGL